MPYGDKLDDAFNQAKNEYGAIREDYLTRIQNSSSLGLQTIAYVAAMNKLADLDGIRDDIQSKYTTATGNGFDVYEGVLDTTDNMQGRVTAVDDMNALCREAKTVLFAQATNYDPGNGGNERTDTPYTPDANGVSPDNNTALKFSDLLKAIPTWAIVGILGLGILYAAGADKTLAKVKSYAA